jgi:hypothetical protein
MCINCEAITKCAILSKPVNQHNFMAKSVCDKTVKIETNGLWVGWPGFEHPYTTTKRKERKIK